MQHLVFALTVTDPDLYARYRAQIAPAMNRHGVCVLKEYDAGGTLHSDAPEEAVTKVAMFGFPSADAQISFFADPEYLAAKSDFAASTTNFEKWVG